MCMCTFQSFPFFFFFFFGLEPLVFPLCRQFIYVHYFRLPDFYSPFGVFLETRELSTMPRLANAFWSSKPLYCNAPITLTLYYLQYINIYIWVSVWVWVYMCVYVCMHARATKYSTVSTWNHRRANSINFLELYSKTCHFDTKSIHAWRQYDGGDDWNQNYFIIITTNTKKKTKKRT